MACKEIDQHVIKMAALGRQFHLGGLYDYRNDSISKDDRRCWESTDMASSTKVNDEFKLVWKRPESESWNKWEQMGLDEHLQMSTVSGIIDKYKGASSYVNNRTDPTHAARVLVFRAKTKREQLDLSALANEDVPRIGAQQGNKEKATHVIVGITYGVEAYCLISQELKSHQIDREAIEEAEENLSKITYKMECALDDNQNLAEFKEQFDAADRKQVNALKCRLYTDLPGLSGHDCSLFEAYKHCLRFIEQMKSDGGKNKAIPIVVKLCPLKVFVSPADAGAETLVKYRDVDGHLVARLCRIWADLEQICARVESMKKGSRPFGIVLKKYQEMLRKSLKAAVVKARESDAGDDEVEKVVNIVETHSLFKPSQLTRWVRYKQAEGEVAGKMTNLAGITFLSSQKEVEKELAESLTAKHALVLYVPPLDERTNEILHDMTDYVNNFAKLVAMEREEDETDDDEEDEESQGTPWHMVQRKRNQVLTQIRYYVDHVDRNKHLENKVQFLITFNETGKRFGCRYSIYEAEKTLTSSNQLPVAPSSLRVKLIPGNKTSKKLSMRVEWDHEDLGYPCTFTVEFRLKDSSDPWKQQKTTKPGETHLTLNIVRESAVEMRAAAETCIGRSEFSQVIDTESALDDQESDGESGISEVEKPSSIRKPRQHQQAVPTETPSGRPTIKGPADVGNSQKKKEMLQPPNRLQVNPVSPSTVEISWSKPAGSSGRTRHSYRVRYWENEQEDLSFEEMDVGCESGCCVEHLQPDTDYSFQVMSVSIDGQTTSEPSQTVTTTTMNPNTRFAEMIVKKCKLITKQNGLDLCAVPLTKVTGCGATTTERFVFGKKDGQKKNKWMQNKTILVMGATGSGKTTLINGMINYIFNVQWDDPFRFQLIQEQAGRSQVESQTSRITAYEIHHQEGFRVPYSLTIVDTPGYGDTKGLERDQEITEMIRLFFEDKGGIQELDVVGFVATASLPRLTPTQVYIFDSVLSIFGNDIKENINFLLTFADSQVPPALSAIKQAGLPYPVDQSGNPLHHKFNNSGFFCTNRESSGTSKTVDKFNRFFWRMGMENFEKFFNVLNTMKTKSLSLTKQVLEERKRLEATIDGLQPLIKVGLAKMEEMRKTKRMIANSQAQIEANENVEFEVEITMPEKVEIPAGRYLTNCNKCYVTCHNPCAYKNDDDKIMCSAMDHSMPKATRSCRICPEKCIWNMHANQPYRWEYVQKKQVTSSDAIKQKYEKELKRKLTAQDLITVLQKDLDDNEKDVLDRVETVSRCIQRLDEIALRPNPFSTPQYIDLIIDAEQQEKRTGFNERIESLKKLRQMAVITTKIKNKESLMNPDGKDDDDDEQTEEYEDRETAYDDDDDSNDGDSQTSVADTDLHKFSSLFYRK